MAKKLIDAIDALASELSTRRGMDQYLAIQAMTVANVLFFSYITKG